MIALLFCALAASQAPDADMTPVAQVADALAAGEQAADEGRAEPLMAAAERLRRLGARPAGEDDDAAARWRRQAIAAGAASPAPLRGRLLGPAYRSGSIAPGQSISTEQIFLAGQRAEVAIVSQGAGTLTMRIGEGDTPICERRVAAPRGGCSWIPTFTRRVEIRLSNPSAQPLRYWLVSN